MREPVFNDSHIWIAENDAIEMFHPERLPAPVSRKVSKSVNNLSRWQLRPAETLLAIIIMHPAYLDLCWWNGNAWTYITTIKKK